MKQIKHSTYLTQKSRQLAVRGALLAGLGGAGLGSLFGWWKIPFISQSPFSLPLILTIGLPCFAVGTGFLFSALNYKQGSLGEDSVARRLSRMLDDDYTLLRNSHFGEERGDVDAILIGPPGVLVLEIKDYTGTGRASGDEWLYRSRGQWRRARKSPLRQARSNSRLVRKHLTGAGLGFVTVRSAVVFTNPDLKWVVDEPAVPLIFPGHLEPFIEDWRNLANRGRRTLSATEIAEIVKVLERPVGPTPQIG